MLSAGKTLYIRTGTYDEWFNNAVPSGTSWANPVTVQKPVVKPSPSHFYSRDISCSI